MFSKNYQEENAYFLLVVSFNLFRSELWVTTLNILFLIYVDQNYHITHNLGNFILYRGPKEFVVLKDIISLKICESIYYIYKSVSKAVSFS